MPLVRVYCLINPIFKCPCYFYLAKSSCLIRNGHLCYSDQSNLQWDNEPTWGLQEAQEWLKPQHYHASLDALYNLQWIEKIGSMRQRPTVCTMEMHLVYYLY